ncbi:hypothetical protein TELCIR_25112, partial [Teladorsagia circumcincta]
LYNSSLIVSVLDTYVNEGSDNAGQTIRLFLLVNGPTQGVEVNVNADGNNLKVLPECQFKYANALILQLFTVFKALQS